MSKAKKERTNRGDLSQYGIFNMSTGVENDLGDDDSDLEAELLALSSGGGSKPKKPQQSKVIPAANLDAMVAESLKDIPSDEDLSGDDDDPDLLNELSEMREPEQVVTPSKSASDISAVLQERLKMYETAEKNAKEAGESGRARRFGRGIKTLHDLIKQANNGRSIKDDDIPPVVAVTVHKPAAVDISETPPPDPQLEPIQPTRTAPAVPKPPVQNEPSVEKVSPTTTVNPELLQLLNSRKDEYKVAALKAKKSGDSVTAINFIKVAKQFEMVIKAVEDGQEIDLSNMPGPPVVETASPVHNEVQSHSAEEPSEPLPEPALITASSIGEALQQRLEVYQKQEEKAKTEGNASKSRRMGRIVKQFEDAIKRNKAGKPVALEDLPTPPGYAPFPGTTSDASPSTSGAASAAVEMSTAIEPQPSKPAPVPAPNPRQNRAQSRIDKQVALLMAKQKEFKEAALNAKRKGEIAQAKEFLRTAKGFDPLIGAAQGGLPVDISSLPVPPSAKSQLEEEYNIAFAEEATEFDPEHLDILSRLEQQLTKQLKLCLTTSDHNKAIGDIAGKNRFEQLALNVTKDLDIIRLAKKSASPIVPKYHYEKKDFSIVKSFTDLSDNDLELCIMRGINYTCSNPKDVDTYVRFEFPFPQEEPVINKTAVVKNTNNPEYNETFTLPIQRNARACQRVFKRHGIKFEVFSKGGFFRSDSLLGTVPIKLQPLETQCELHESFDLLDGRKKVGGKLEIRLRLRDPLLTRQVEQLSEKWLVLNH